MTRQSHRPTPPSGSKFRSPTWIAPRPSTTPCSQTELKDDNTGPNPMAIFPARGESGVAGHLYPGKPAASDSGNTIHLAVSDPLEDALDRVRENGGKVLSDMITIPAGRFAYCRDPDGNSVGLFGR